MCIIAGWLHFNYNSTGFACFNPISVSKRKKITVFSEKYRIMFDMQKIQWCIQNAVKLVIIKKMHIFFNIPCKKIQMNGVRLLHTRVNISVEVKMQDAIEQFRLFFFWFHPIRWTDFIDSMALNLSAVNGWIIHYVQSIRVITLIFLFKIRFSFFCVCLCLNKSIGLKIHYTHPQSRQKM